MSALPLSLQLYRAATATLEPFAPLLLRRRAGRGKEEPKRLGERLGRASLPRPEGPLAWLHGASVGEGLSLLPLAKALRASRPDLQILVTSGTVTSARLLARRLPTGVLHQYVPIDTPRAAGRFFDHWRPDLGVLVESELWPNLIMAAHRHRTPLALLSARLSEASLSGWARAPAAARALLSPLALVMGQDEAAAGRLSQLGARDDGRLNLKLAGEPLPVDEAELLRARWAADGRPVLVAASTHFGEEEAVLEAFAALQVRPERPLLVVVPRHPERGRDVAELAAARGLSVRRQAAGEAFDGAADVYVADRLGELGLWFRLAASVLVGGGLTPGVGGHNPLEPARLGAPVITGPHVANWRAVYEALDEADAVTLTDSGELASALAADLDDPAAAARRAQRARTVAAGGAAALEQAVSRLAALLP